METPAVNIGDQLTFTAIVSPINGDENEADNFFTFNQIVVGSYDPNDIICLEGDTVSPSEIGKYLHYAINFENTGNYPAENIVVKDIIDATIFDVKSLQVLNSSDAVTARITGNVAEFIFQNILYRNMFQFTFQPGNNIQIHKGSCFIPVMLHFF